MWMLLMETFHCRTEGHRFEAVVLEVLNIDRNAWKEEYVDLSSNSVQDSLEEKIAREQNHKYWTRLTLTLTLTLINIPSDPPQRK